MLVDARAAGLPDDGTPLAENGRGATAYADAVATYLATVASKSAVFLTTIARWRSGEDKSAPAFGRQAIPMVWDYAEVNPFAGAGGDLSGIVDGAVKVLVILPAGPAGFSSQEDATADHARMQRCVVCTDPPYYDNIGYADLSDYFYVWLRRSLRIIYADLFRTVLVPKADELIASPFRHNGSRVDAEEFFESGLLMSFEHMRAKHDPAYPLTLFYAYKQREIEGDEPGERQSLERSEKVFASTGWETMLEGLVGAGFSITATWPMRTEMTTRMIGRGTNALASSILLACRPRADDAPITTRREFIATLRRELDKELAVLLDTNIAPVDLAQATVGPGLAIFTRYSRVIEANGEPMSVHTALALINEVLFQVLEAADERLDPYTRFCIAWYDQFGYASGSFDDANKLSLANNVSVDGLKRSGVLWSQGGRARLLRREELPAGWEPKVDNRVPVWECLQHLIVRLENAGVDGAGELLAKIGDERGEQSKQLAVRLYELCDRKRWTGEAFAYNQLVQEFPDIQKVIAEEAGRYDGFVREYPQIQQRAQALRDQQLELF